VSVERKGLWREVRVEGRSWRMREELRWEEERREGQLGEVARRRNGGKEAKKLNERCRCGPAACTGWLFYGCRKPSRREKHARKKRGVNSELPAKEGEGKRRKETSSSRPR